MRPIVYVAGPYTGPDPIVNTRDAVHMGDRLWDLGFAPYIPHLSMLWHLIKPQAYGFWLRVGLEWVEHADVMFRLPGKSPGADREVEYAEELGIPVFNDIIVLNSWKLSNWGVIELTGE